MRFWRKQCREDVWVSCAERPSQPHVEKVGEIRITDVVVIGRVGRCYDRFWSVNMLCIQLLHNSCGSSVAAVIDHLRYELCHSLEVSRGVSEWIGLSEVPDHRQ